MGPRPRALVAVLALALTDPWPPALAAGAPPDPGAILELERENASLRLEVELASKPEFYLVLDLDRSTLRLLLRGVVLREYPVLGATVRQPRRPLRAGPAPADWTRQAWVKGTLDPPRDTERVEVRAPAPSAEGAEPSAPLVPPTPEERHPLRARYLVRFEGGLGLEVLPDPKHAGAPRTGFREWKEDLVDAFRAEGSRGRIRIVLDPEDAATLYRALPPDVSLLVRAGLAAP